MYIDFVLEAFRKHENTTAIIYEDKEYTYKWLLHRYNYWKGFLKERGVTSNTTVALEADFSPNSIALVLAIIENGNIFIPLSKNLKNASQLAEIAEANYYLSLENESLNIIDRKVVPQHELLSSLVKSKNPGLVLFSSGTTGDPKGAVHDLVPLLEKFKLPGRTFRTITFLLFDHIGGFNTLFHMISNGGTIAVTKDRSPEEVCRIIDNYKIELLPTTPTFINMILFSRAYERYDISSLKLVTYGTEPMPESTLKTFHNKFPDIKLKQTYGLSELGIMRSKSENSESLWIKVGGEDYQTKIVDGIFYIKARTAMKGYLNADSPFDEDGWFNTQDRVEQKGDYIRFLGRVSDIINVGGEKVYPAEVESVLLDYPGINDVSVTGEPHPLMGQIVTARVTMDDSAEKNKVVRDIKLFCSKRLEKFKIPVKIAFGEGDFSSDRFKRQR